MSYSELQTNSSVDSGEISDEEKRHIEVLPVQ